MIYPVLSIFLLQESSQQEWLFASDKINAVMTVTLVIFLAFIGYLVINQRKVKALEKKMDNLDHRS